ncbi:hypothetical protein Tco_0256237 [Tanacetum coccineum]
MDRSQAASSGHPRISLRPRKSNRGICPHVGKGNEQTSKNSDRLVSDAALWEYCDKHYHQLLPTIAEKVHQEKVHQEKLKKVKVRLNFEGCSERNSKVREVSQHSESRTPNVRGDHRRGRWSRCSFSVSGSPKRASVFSGIRRDRSESPRQKSEGKGRRDGGVFNRLGDKGKSILANFLQPKKCIKDPVKIHHIKQREGESTEDFMQRFEAESRHVKGAPECMRISGFIHGITNSELIKRFYDNIPKSVDEIMRVTTTFLRGEVAASNQARNKKLLAWKQQDAGRKQNFDRREISGISRDQSGDVTSSHSSQNPQKKFWL